MILAAHAADSIGQTPLVRVGHKLEPQAQAAILAKIEFRNPAGSVKDRIGWSMIQAGRQAGKVTDHTMIVEPTSGNTGIGLAMACAVQGLRLVLTMPESMSVERQKLLRHLGAQVVLTPAAQGMNGAIQMARDMVAGEADAFMPDQFANPANPQAHRRTTGPEIAAATGGKVDILVVAVGTGGTLTGIGEVLKAVNPKLRVVAVEPAESAVLSGGQPGPHKIQGIGAGFVPPVLNRALIDEVVAIPGDLALETARRLARTEGMACGISSGAALAASLQVALRSENAGKTIVTVFASYAERYLSTELFI